MTSKELLPQLGSGGGDAVSNAADAPRNVVQRTQVASSNSLASVSWLAGSTLPAGSAVLLAKAT